MINNILIYKWGSTCELPLMQVVKKLGISVYIYDEKIEDYHADCKFAMGLIQILQNTNLDAVFSFDYFPLISMICEINRLPYISWIYDCPMLTLQSKTLSNSMNYIYCFDKMYVKRLIKEGAKHCFHLPLGGNGMLMNIIEEKEKVNPELKEKYTCDISFLGNLYNERRNRYRTAEFSAYTKGFIEGIINAQIRIYGYNFIKNVVTENIVEEIVNKCNLKLGEIYRQDSRQMAADIVNVEISSREREQVLREIGIRHQLVIYTGSNIPSNLKKLGIKDKGYADYDKEMPFIFHNSKININITAKTIESGIPLRVFDILSCGGFCLTNYQPEIDELFEEGKDLAIYTDMQDMMRKINYYLEHDEERKQIALNGYHKIIQQHDLMGRVKGMFCL